MTTPNWPCPFCEWKHRPAPGVELDYGLIHAHLYGAHEERDGAGYTTLIPRQLLRSDVRRGFVCPFPDSTHVRNRPWVQLWQDDGEPPFETPEENPFWAGSVDVGLHLIAAHMEEMHTAAVYRQWGSKLRRKAVIPKSALNKLRRAGIRGSPGVRLEG